MLTLSGGQAETLFDLGLPVEVAELPADLAALDALLNDLGLLGPIEAAWQVEHRDRGRPSVAMDRFLRLMIVKARSGGWGYETLVREVYELDLARYGEDHEETETDMFELNRLIAGHPRR